MWRKRNGIRCRQLWPCRAQDLLPGFGLPSTGRVDVLTTWFATTITVLMIMAGFDDPDVRAEKVMVMWWGALASRLIEDPSRTNQLLAAAVPPVLG